ncbi:hypothetical protein B0A49_04455 [Cryomyces minteri]|uniref:Uncharacterized protein n=1 Tax=Cryomyces minteri TaxID=331657 RepID=A0A4U0XEE8_9PEZI|nr:hypothetical protein B0A49_04455 [Cryomyces minteri]
MTNALSMIEDMQNGGGPQRPLKIRILCTPAGVHKIDVSATSPVSLETLYPSLNFMEAPERLGRSASVAWKVRLDTKPTAPSDCTRFKTTSRHMYDEAWKRAGIASFAVQEEVLLYNHNNEIMEGSLTTVYFYRDGHWCTPPESSGGLPGTTRRWALDNSDLRIQQRLTLVSDVADGEVVWLSNGVRGFFPGQIKLGKRSPLEPKTDET